MGFPLVRVIQRKRNRWRRRREGFYHETKLLVWEPNIVSRFITASKGDLLNLGKSPRTTEAPRERRSHKLRGLITLIQALVGSCISYFWDAERRARSRERHRENTGLIALWSGTRASPLPNACSRVKSLSGLHNGPVPGSSCEKCLFVSDRQTALETLWKLLKLLGLDTVSTAAVWDNYGETV